MTKVVWFEIYVEDMDRAQKFYEAVLETSLTDLANPTKDELQMKGFPGDMESYGSGGALVKMEGFPVGQNSSLVYFGCEDCGVEESRVKDAGGEVVQPKMSIGEHGFVTLCTDPEGNMFGLHSMN